MFVNVFKINVYGKKLEKDAVFRSSIIYLCDWHSIIIDELYIIFSFYMYIFTRIIRIQNLELLRDGFCYYRLTQILKYE